MNNLTGKTKIQKLTIDDAGYPEYLRQIASPPKELYYLGNLRALLDQPRLAVVGSRKVTPYGKAATAQLVRPVAEQGVVIISGLALGVDGLAHQACLEGGGRTIAVLANGLDMIYPATHRDLAERILQGGGAIVSEYPTGTLPLPPNFVARNRIVSGLSQGVLIIEAAEKSGSLHTANFALDQGRTVMAVPGNITSQFSAGTNNLIKAGATPVICAEDILSTLGIELAAKNKAHMAANAEEAIILQLLGQGISDGGELLAQSTLTAITFSQTLTMLELTGKIRPLGAGHWALV